MNDIERKFILALAESNMKIYRARKKVFLSDSGFRYHLNKIQKETGLSPWNFYDLCKLVEMAKEEDDDKL